MAQFLVVKQQQWQNLLQVEGPLTWQVRTADFIDGS